MNNPLDTFRVDGINGEIQYREYTLPHSKNPQELPIEYFLRDALHYSESVTHIDLIKINSDHNQGTGSELLQTFINEHVDEFIILNAGALEEIEDDEEFYALLDNLSSFYEKNGFVNINNLIGFCSESIVFGYGNATLRERLNL